MVEELWIGFVIFLFVTIAGYIANRQGQMKRLYSDDGGEEIRKAINGKYKVRFVGWLACVIGVLLYAVLSFAMFSEIGNRFFTYVLCVLFLLPCFTAYLFLYGIYAFVVHDLENRIKGR